MAQLVGIPPETFGAMRQIRDTALVRFDSLFTPERNLWSLQNLRRFHACFVERFDDGEGTFLEKFRKQLEGADDDVLQLSAELLYAQQFFTTLTGGDKKIENVATVLSWRTHPISIPEWAVAGVQQGFAADQNFNQHRPFHLGWLNEFLIHWHQLAENDRAAILAQPFLFAEEARKVDFERGAHQPMREAWLYMMFPDAFESISSRRDKKLIRAAFANRLLSGPTDNIDTDLLAIRTSLTLEQGDGFHFYRPPVIEQWQTQQTKPGSSALRVGRIGSF
jgi:5-methylcytosine-specific restriction enzyme B